MSKAILPQFEQIDTMPTDALESIRLDFKDIDERTDKILEITRSTRVECEIDQIWNSVMGLFYTATREIERLRGEGDAE